MPLSGTGVVTGKSTRSTGYLLTTMKVFITFNKPGEYQVTITSTVSIVSTSQSRKLRLREIVVTCTSSQGRLPEFRPRLGSLQAHTFHY